MSKKNNDFFKEKKAWSEVKDDLLRCYLKPYFAKILHTHKPIIYVDCFAGKGKFDDGKPGSPLIALEIINNVLEETKTLDRTQIHPIFIELKFANELKDNLSNYPGVEIVSGAYENTLNEILKTKEDCNIFLYIDPYGIKSLDFSMFDKLSHRKFNTVELLLNLNSFGFIREACNVMKAKFKIDDKNFWDDIVEYEPSILDATDKSIEALNRIAGGDYWQKIITQYKNTEIDIYKAEAYFVEQYCQRLSDCYKYVLNMPIRIRKNKVPKYRMIHVTNHPAGCVLMADNIIDRWQILKVIQNDGQITLFQEDPDNRDINVSELRRNIIEHFSQYNTWTPLTDAIAAFFVKYGVICKSGDITKMLKKLETDKRLDVSRYPAYTATNKPSQFMTERDGKTVSIKWVK